MAQAYNCVYLDKMLKKKYQPRPTSRFLGKKGDKLSNLTLKITKVRVEDDPYRTHVIGTTPVFFVRQRLTAIDASGNLVNLTFASGNPATPPDSCPPWNMPTGRVKCYISLRHVSPRHLKVTAYSTRG